MEITTIQPVNAQPVQWWQEGIPGYLVNHPIPVGAGVALLGHVTGKGWVRTAGLIYAAWGAVDEIMRKRQAAQREVLRGAEGRLLPKPAWWDLPTTTPQQRLDYLAPPR